MSLNYSKSNMKNILVFCLCLLPVFVLGQLPATNVYVFDMKVFNTSDTYSFTNPRLLTGDNFEGYNNQPQFINGELYITSQRDSLQTDIYKFNLKKRVQTRITGTIESEYSPTAMPDNKHISVVRVSADGNDTQQLWKLPATGGKASLLVDSITAIGYHEWLNERIVALFIVGEPHQLILANTKTGDFRKVRSEIGRCLQKTPEGNLSFVHKNEEEGWYIKVVNPANFTIRPVIATLPGSEDFVWTPEGTIYMANGSKLYRYKSGLDDDWYEVADFSSYGIKKITRMAIENNQIAIVAQEIEK